ncbi:phosphate ABC transporter permease subunit PstC [Sporosarcina sp. A2]|uniref:phosphate ABC transporter permease subunit PstC n=1 Tax=Sporosarcina sp. A2 TaxID=3393449 RepID=UPI003D79BDA9
MAPESEVNSSREVRNLIRSNQNQKTLRKSVESWIPRFLFLLAFLSVLTTVGILIILMTETVEFFKTVPLLDFFTGTVLKPLSQTPEFGILPLVMGTLVSSGIALLVAGPIGIMAAIFLSEYASRRVRSILKPALELLAGVPTIVYGFFAFTFITPLLRQWIPSLEATNILSPGLVMGIMIIPMIASLSEDAMQSVPEAMREGSAALGATKLETALKVVVPAALSGIIASFVLGVSRALGETMIVAIASGSSKNFSFNITESMQTMTAYIVEVTSGDAAAGSTVYYSLYAVAMTLFVITLTMNVIAGKISRKFREVY